MTPLTRAVPAGVAEVPAREAGAQRWIILAMLFAVTVLNFVDRQTLSILAPQLRADFHMSATEYGRVVAAFQFGMMSCELPMGALMDRVGVRQGFSFAVLWWSVATALHAVARSALQFGLFRFWMGTGECGNYSGAMKVITRWFGVRDRALAVGVFNSGSMVGSIVAPPLIVYLAQRFGYQVAFVMPALLGIVWVLVWRRVYPRTLAQEPAIAAVDDRPVPTRALLRDNRSWAVMACRFFVGPVMQFYWYWMPDYLFHVRGLSMTAIGALSWIPYLFGDVGSLGGGWFAKRLLARGWTLVRARQMAMGIGAALCLLGLTVFAIPSLAGAIAVIGLILFGHTFLSANMFASVTDLFPAQAVGRATGLTGVAGGFSGLLFPLLTGYLVDHFSYLPVFCLAAVMPAIGVVSLFVLTKSADWRAAQ